MKLTHAVLLLLCTSALAQLPKPGGSSGGGGGATALTGLSDWPTSAAYTVSGSDPSGACNAGSVHFNSTADSFWVCNDGSWSPQAQYFKSASAPTTCTSIYAGAIWVRTTNGAVYVCDGSNYQIVGGAAITSTTVTFSATPTFTCTTQIQHFLLTLTGNVTSSTLSGCNAGALLSFKFIQDAAGGRTLVMPTGFPTLSISTTASKYSVVEGHWDGSAFVQHGPMVSDDAGVCIPGSSSGCTNLITDAAGSGSVTIPAGTYTVAKKTVDDLNAPTFAADAGSNDTYVATLSPVPSAYVTGNHYRFKAATANTGAATINFNSLGAKTIKKAAGGITTDLADNDIRAGQWVDLVYDGTNMQMQSLLGNAPGGGSSTWHAGGVFVASSTPVARAPLGKVLNMDSGGSHPLSVYAAYIAANGSEEISLTFPIDSSWVPSGTLTVDVLLYSAAAASEQITARTACSHDGSAIVPLANALATGSAVTTSTTLRKKLTVAGVATSGTVTCQAGGFIEVIVGKVSSANILYLVGMQVTQ